MPDYVRVRDKDTGHEYTILAARFNDAAHTRIDKPALGRDGLPAAPKHRTTVAKKAAAKKAESGHQATTQKES